MCPPNDAVVSTGKAIPPLLVSVQHLSVLYTSSSYSSYQNTAGNFDLGRPGNVPQTESMTHEGQGREQEKFKRLNLE